MKDALADPDVGLLAEEPRPPEGAMKAVPLRRSCRPAHRLPQGETRTYSNDDMALNKTVRDAREAWRALKAA